MPMKTGAVPFVQGRLDPIIDSNRSLKEHFRAVDNRLHKQTIDNIALRIRGTNIWTELREIPADVLILDERDMMVEENLPEAFARLDGSSIQRVVELSTPTAPGHGIDSQDGWHASDMRRWWVPCPHCRRFQVITFAANVEPWLAAREEADQ
jgi:phage terminase large subunit GpA-like protein